MGKLDVTDRLEFLAKQFDVFEHESEDDIITKCETMIEAGWEESDNLYFTANGSIIKTLGVLSKKKNKNGFTLQKISVPYDIFTDMVGADPTPNKICLQWMLNTYTKYLKSGEDGMDEAFRFAFEDLPQANEYLTFFEANKRKKKFKVMAQYSLKGFKDIGNINEYKNLEQLFDAVDPFIERDPSEIEGIMNKYVDMGQAEIPFRDRKYTVYMPLTTDAATIFNNFASWCTVRSGNGMFNSYTKDNRKPNGKVSALYIVMDNGFFTGDNENIYHIHFETKQIRDRSNGPNVDFYSLILSKSEGMTNYFGSELLTMAREFEGGIGGNYYIDTLIDFGFTEALFDFFDDETSVILIDSQTSDKLRRVPKIPDVSRFHSVTHFVILDSSVHELHPSIGSLNKLKNLTLAGNNIEKLPKEIGKLSNLLFLNLWNNPLVSIPDEIKFLDTSMGGKLDRIVVNKDKISEANYQKLKELLPNVEF